MDTYSNNNTTAKAGNQQQNIIVIEPSTSSTRQQVQREASFETNSPLQSQLQKQPSLHRQASAEVFFFNFKMTFIKRIKILK